MYIVYIRSPHVDISALKMPVIKLIWEETKRNINITIIYPIYPAINISIQ